MRSLLFTVLAFAAAPAMAQGFNAGSMGGTASQMGGAVLSSNPAIRNPVDSSVLRSAGTNNGISKRDVGADDQRKGKSDRKKKDDGTTGCPDAETACN